MRERLSHNRRLWIAVRATGLIDYRRFCSLAAKLPALYLTQGEHYDGYTLLLPGIPVSCGTLPDIGQRLGSVDGRPALLTDLAPSFLDGDRLTLVVLEQVNPSGRQPRLAASAADVTGWTLHDGCVALVDDRFSDDRYGWALVRRRRQLCSTQTAVTAATAYRQYLTSEALERAAASYGGLTA